MRGWGRSSRLTGDMIYEPGQGGGYRGAWRLAAGGEWRRCGRAEKAVEGQTLSCNYNDNNAVL